MPNYDEYFWDNRPKTGSPAQIIWVKDRAAFYKFVGDEWVVYQADAVAAADLPAEAADGATVAGEDSALAAYDATLGLWLGPARKLTMLAVENQPYDRDKTVCRGSAGNGEKLVVVDIPCVVKIDTPNDGGDHWLVEVNTSGGTTITLTTEDVVPNTVSQVPLVDGSVPIILEPGPTFIWMTVSQVGTPGNILELDVAVVVRPVVHG